MATIDIRKEDCEKLLNMCSLNYVIGKRQDDRDLMNTSSELFASLNQSLNSKGYYVEKVGTDSSNGIGVTYSLYEVREADGAKIVARDKDHLIELIDARIREQGPNCDLNDIDVSHIREMRELFSSSPRKDFNGDIKKMKLINYRLYSSRLILKRKLLSLTQKQEKFLIFIIAILKQQGLLVGHKVLLLM